MDLIEELDNLNKKIINLNKEDLVGDSICKEPLSIEDRTVGSLLVGMMGKKKKKKKKFFF